MSSPTPSGPADQSPGGTDRARDKDEVEANWEMFFDPGTSLADKTELLENGERLEPLVQNFTGDPRVGQVEAEVKTVKFTSDTAADVNYSLSLKDQPVLPDASGKAVLQDGTWKVSVATLCALVSMDAQGDAAKAPGC